MRKFTFWAVLKIVLAHFKSPLYKASSSAVSASFVRSFGCQKKCKINWKND